MSLLLLWFQEFVADGAGEEGERDGELETHKFDFGHEDLGTERAEKDLEA